ncbi:hypothetical protein Cadr_000007827 [Camelus dromedarius]|uniref:Uncharacterized protein n=1 Tax=Camelus dromedarius TaxID=9838 RepID=A0A5N4E045_CAMDR|nr:hypothetical protein Cadr_000007827 [Camelus dromedarius]
MRINRPPRPRRQHCAPLPTSPGPGWPEPCVQQLRGRHLPGALAQGWGTELSVASRPQGSSVLRMQVDPLAQRRKFPSRDRKQSHSLSTPPQPTVLPDITYLEPVLQRVPGLHRIRCAPGCAPLPTTTSGLGPLWRTTPFPGSCLRPVRLLSQSRTDKCGQVRALFRVTDFLLCSHMVEGVSEFSGPLYKAPNPFMTSPTFQQPAPNTVTSGFPHEWTTAGQDRDKILRRSFLLGHTWTHQNLLPSQENEGQADLLFAPSQHTKTRFQCSKQPPHPEGHGKTNFADRRFWSVPTEAARCTAPCRSPSNKLLKKNPRTHEVGMCQQAPKQALCTPTLVPVPQASLTTAGVRRGLQAPAGAGLVLSGATLRPPNRNKRALEQPTPAANQTTGCRQMCLQIIHLTLQGPSSVPLHLSHVRRTGTSPTKDRETQSTVILNGSLLQEREHPRVPSLAVVPPHAWCLTHSLEEQVLWSRAPLGLLLLWPRAGLPPAKGSGGPGHLPQALNTLKLSVCGEGISVPAQMTHKAEGCGQRTLRRWNKKPPSSAWLVRRRVRFDLQEREAHTAPRPTTLPTETAQTGPRAQMDDRNRGHLNHQSTVLPLRLTHRVTAAHGQTQPPQHSKQISMEMVRFADGIQARIPWFSTQPPTEQRNGQRGFGSVRPVLSRQLSSGPREQAEAQGLPAVSPMPRGAAHSLPAWSPAREPKCENEDSPRARPVWPQSLPATRGLAHPGSASRASEFGKEIRLPDYTVAPTESQAWGWWAGGAFVSISAQARYQLIDACGSVAVALLPMNLKVPPSPLLHQPSLSCRRSECGDGLSGASRNKPRWDPCPEADLGLRRTQTCQVSTQSKWLSGSRRASPLHPMNRSGENLAFGHSRVTNPRRTPAALYLPWAPRRAARPWFSGDRRDFLTSRTRTTGKHTSHPLRGLAPGLASVLRRPVKPVRLAPDSAALPGAHHGACRDAYSGL